MSPSVKGGAERRCKLFLLYLGRGDEGGAGGPGLRTDGVKSMAWIEWWVVMVTKATPKPGKHGGGADGGGGGPDRRRGVHPDAHPTCLWRRVLGTGLGG